MAGGRSRSGGRIQPHQHDTNNEAVILGEDVEVLDHHLTSVQTTEQRDLHPKKAKRNYHNHIKHIYKFWHKKYPRYYSIGVCQLIEEEMGDSDAFHWNHKHDLIYEGLNMQVLKAFLVHKKKKNGRISSHVQLWKYHNAIVFGAMKETTDKF